MKKLRTSFKTLVAALTLSASIAAHAIPVTQIGFALDASASIGEENYNLVRAGLISALQGLPQDSTVEITVIAYGSMTDILAFPTVLTPQTISLIADEINAHSFSFLGNLTDTGLGIDLLSDVMRTESANFSDSGTTSIINVVTDGQPTATRRGGTPQQGAENAAIDACNDGIDAVSLEAIGSGFNSGSALNNMLAIANGCSNGPASTLGLDATNIPNPVNGSWVIPVSDFDSFAAVVDAKVQAIVAKVPEPNTWLLFTLGITGLVASRMKRKAD